MSDWKRKSSFWNKKNKQAYRFRKIDQYWPNNWLSSLFKQGKNDKEKKNRQEFKKKKQEKKMREREKIKEKQEENELLDLVNLMDIVYVDGSISWFFSLFKLLKQ